MTLLTDEQRDRTRKLLGGFLWRTVLAGVGFLAAALLAIESLALRNNTYCRTCEAQSANWTMGAALCLLFAGGMIASVARLGYRFPGLSRRAR